MGASDRRKLWICRFAWTTQTRCPHTHSSDRKKRRKRLEDSFEEEDVTAQLPRRAYDSRREAATSGIGRRSASMILHPCFLAVERKERIVAKSAAPSEVRK